MEGAFRSGTILVGKYRIEHLLGRDGMCLVFSASYLHTGQPVVLKILVPETVTSLAVHARFLREAQSMAQLCGEHVARTIDVGILPEGVPYAAIEALHGVDLGSELARRGALIPGDAVDTVLQACDALAEAHAHGMVHGDIKPANLFFASRPDGTVRIKVLGLERSSTAHAMAPPGARPDARGTPGYMAPEQVTRTDELDGRTDVWGLGVVLYECLTGRHPFHAESVSLMLQAASSESPRPMEPGIPRPLQVVVLRCLEKPRDARFPSIADLAAALAPFAHDQRAAAAIVDRTSFMSQGPGGGFELTPHAESPILAAPPMSARPAAPPSRRRYVVLGLAVLAISLSGIAAAALLAPDRSHGPSEPRTAPGTQAAAASSEARPAPSPQPPPGSSDARPAPSTQPRADATVAAASPKRQPGEQTDASPRPSEQTARPPASPQPEASAPPRRQSKPSSESPAQPKAESPATRTSPRAPAPESPRSAERIAARSPKQPAERPPGERASASAPATTRSRRDSCETVDADELMTRAAIQYDAGAPAAALSFTRVALGCKQTERMYWLAVMYACAAHDLATAKQYFPKVPANLQSGLETKCRRENFDVRSR